jgi:hypothetical protein
MSEHKPILPATAAGGPPREISFEPAKLRPRHDGWTAERQIAFIEKLADCNSVSAAARYVGMTRESARQLRRHARARDFRDAWDAALDCSYAEVEEAAAERSKRGVARPIFYKGEQVGEWRHFDERLTMFLLRFRRRHRFGPEADSLPRTPRDIPGIDPDEVRPFDPEDQLGGLLEGGDFDDLPGSENDDDHPWRAEDDR